MAKTEPTLADLEAEAEAAKARLEAARAQAIEDAKLTQEEAQALFQKAIEDHGAADNDEARHAVASEALKRLEAGGVKGNAIDILAQHVVNARGE